MPFLMGDEKGIDINARLQSSMPSGTPEYIYIYIYIYIIKNNFISTFGKTNLIHLTTNVMFSGQRFAILDVFIWNPKLKLKCPYIYLNAWTTATGCKID